MDKPESRLFSAAALAILDRMPYDPLARGGYEVLSGALMWPDEFPRLGSAAWAAIAPGCLYRFLLAYRASITLHPERAQPYDLWQQIAERAPNWPGLRSERRGEQAARRLRAALRRQEKCLAELDAQLQAGSQEAEPNAAPDRGRLCGPGQVSWSFGPSDHPMKPRPGTPTSPPGIAPARQGE